MMAILTRFLLRIEILYLRLSSNRPVGKVERRAGPPARANLKSCALVFDLVGGDSDLTKPSNRFP
jgi:hypothetical protein